MDFKDIVVELPKHDADVTIVFPGGKTLLIQARPSNADEGYNGSLDVILPANATVTAWIGDDMEQAPETDPAAGTPCVRTAKQLVTELPGDYA